MLVVKNGAPASLVGLLDRGPRNGMTAGGIFPALFGTVCIVIGALVASVPAGRGRGRLPERVRTGQLV